MNVTQLRAQAACLGLLTLLLVIVVGCTSLVGIVSLPQEINSAVNFTRGDTEMTITVGSAGGTGAVDPRDNSTIELVIYSIGPLTAGDVDATVELLAGETVVQDYTLTLEQTAFEPLPPLVMPIATTDGSELDTRYAATLTANCASCDPSALLPETYSWRATVTRADGLNVSGVMTFNYTVYVGPIVAP